MPCLKEEEKEQELKSKKTKKIEIIQMSVHTMASFHMSRSV